MTLALATLAFTSPAGAESQYSTLYVFGTSTVDRGRVAELVFEQNPDLSFDIPVSPPYFEGRYTNGPTYVERLPDLLGFPAAPEQNFAVAGAETGDENGFDGMLPDASGGTIELPGIAEQIDAFLETGASIPSDAVVVLHGGAVDYAHYLDENPDPSSDEIAAKVDETISNIEENIRRLAAGGARTFVVPNEAFTSPDTGAEQAFSQLHEQAINSEIGSFAAELGVEIVVADFATGIELLISTPETFGLTNVSDPCLTSASPTLPASFTPGDVCSNPDEFLFWDASHLTSVAHQFLAEFTADTLTAPGVVPAAAGIAVFASDDFLRRMDVIARGGGFSEPAGKTLPASAPDNRPYEVFLSAETTQGSGDFEGDAARGFDYSIASVLGGVAFQPAETLSLGLVGGYDKGDADLDGIDGSTELTSFRVGALAGYDTGRLFASAGLAYGLDDYDLFRQTMVPELASSAETEGGSFGAFGTAGYRFGLGSMSFGPLVGLRYNRVSIDAYDESGAPGLDMRVDTQAADALIGSAGLLATIRTIAGGARIVSHVELSIDGDLLGGERTLTTALVTVPEVDRHLEIESAAGAYGRLSGGVSVKLPAGIKLLLDAEATLGRDGGDEYSVLSYLAARF